MGWLAEGGRGGLLPSLTQKLENIVFEIEWGDSWNVAIRHLAIFTHKELSKIPCDFVTLKRFTWLEELGDWIGARAIDLNLERKRRE